MMVPEAKQKHDVIQYLLKVDTIFGSCRNSGDFEGG